MASVLLATSEGVAAPSGAYGPMPLEKPFQRELLRQAQGLGVEFERLGLVIDEGPYAEWIQAVGARLAPEPTDPYINYRFSLLRDPTPNAFSLADGHVYVHTGTLAWLQNEAQLEALLAHELAHVAGHHTLVSSRVANQREIGSTVVTGVLSPLTGLFTDLVAFGESAVTRVSLASYSRELEREADDWGVELLQRQGLDGTAMVALFEQLARSVAGRDDQGATLGRSHPRLYERVETLRARAGSASTEAARTDAAYVAFVSPLAVRTIESYVDANQFQIAVELGRSLIERLPDDAAVRVAVGDAWQALGPLEGSPDAALTRGERQQIQRSERRRTRRERYERALRSAEGQINLSRHLAEAESQYRRALELDPTMATAWRGLGEVHGARSEGQEAALAYLEYLRLAPDAADAAVVLARAEELATGNSLLVPRALRDVVVLPPLVSAAERRVGADMARPAVAEDYERRAAAKTAAVLRSAGYEVRIVTRAQLEADPLLHELVLAANQRFATVRSVLVRRRAGVTRVPYELGDDAVRLAQQLGADGLVFQQLDVTVAAWGQMTRAMILSTLTFLFRDIAGAAHADLVLVDGYEGRVLSHHASVSRVIGRGALTSTDVAATLTEAALRKLDGPDRHQVMAPRDGELPDGAITRLESMLAIQPGTDRPR